MGRKGFTFIEILVVVVIVGSLTSLGIKGFKHSRDSHQVDSLLQELTLLRTSILAYKEMHGKLPEIEFSELSSANFDALKPFWHPFNPGSSKIVKGGKWLGEIGADENTTYIVLRKGDDNVAFNMALLKGKIQGVCRVSPSGVYFYILDSYKESPGEGFTYDDDGRLVSLNK